ncbi:MAG: IspD/TarI family cytidylyltransferase, partial [Actinomycetota bacterium]
AAHAKADAEGFVGTDESQLIERYGGRIAIVAGSVDNIKLTYPEDFALAEAIIEARS